MNIPPSGANVPGCIEMTRKRLWFLYQLAALTKADVTAITGWTRGQIYHAVHKWDLVTFGSQAYPATNHSLDRAMARYLRLDESSIATIEQRIDLQHMLRARLREVLLCAPVEWGAIDEFPWPEELP